MTDAKPGVIGATILTRSGTYFDYLNPANSTISPVDIAAGLSKAARFAGQTREFYSVAQHSLLVAKMVPFRFALSALMHDAAEAYLGDIPSPLKQLLPDFKLIERRVEQAIADRFALVFPFPPEIKHADLRALKTEREDLMPEALDRIPWPMMERFERHPDKITPWPPEVAEAKWLAAFYAMSSLTDIAA